MQRPLLLSLYRCISPKRYHAGLKHLDLAYGDSISQQEKFDILKTSLLHFLFLPFQWIASCFWSKQELLDMVEFSDESIVHVKEALDRGKGVVAFSAHSGVWEAGTARFAYQFPGQTVMITKKISPPWLDQLLAGSRRKSGVGLVDMKGAMKGLITALRNNQIVMLLSDQNRPDGIFVPFFGRPAKTTPLVGMMAWKLDCAVVMVSNYKTERGSEVKVSRPLDFDERPEDRDEGILHYSRVMNEQLEKLILAEPGQYLWTHLRYRSSPESLDSLYDA